MDSLIVVTLTETKAFITPECKKKRDICSFSDQALVGHTSPYAWTLHGKSQVGIPILCVGRTVLS